MSALALFELLQDFGTPPTAARPTAVQSVQTFSTPRQPAPDPVPDPAELIAAEVARAEIALAQRLNEEHSAVLEAEQRKHAAELEALTHRLGEDAAAMIADRLADMEQRVSELTTAATARIMSGVLSEALQERSLDRLARSIRLAVQDKEAVRIRISGPASLYATLAAALPELAARFDHTQAATFDLTVAIDEDIFETRLSEWSAALTEMLS